MFLRKKVYQKLYLILGQILIFSFIYYFLKDEEFGGINVVQELIREEKSLKLIFFLGARPAVEYAIKLYLSESKCFEFSDRHDDRLIALSQYLLQHF